MALATLSVDLEARLARFEGDLGKATRLLDKFAADGVRSANAVRDVFAGTLLASGFEQGLRAVIDLFPSLIEGAGKFEDLADVTGGSAAGFAKFQTAADVAGVSVEELAGLSVRLTAALGKITDEGKGAGQALANLGVPIKELQALSADQQLARLSVAFNAFEDGVGKTSNALALFGRNGPAILKFFKEYGDGADQAGKLTAEQIRLADEWADKHARLQSEFRQTAQVIAVSLLPSLNAMADGLQNGITSIIGVKAAADELARDRAILDFAEGGAIAVATLADGFIAFGKVAMATIATVKAVGADLNFVLKLPSALTGTDGRDLQTRLDDVSKLWAERTAAAEVASKRYLDFIQYDDEAVRKAMRLAFANQRAAIDPEIKLDAQRMARRVQTLTGASGGKPALASVTVPDKAGGSSSKAQDSTFERFLDKLQRQQDLAQAELANGDKLSEADRARITLLDELAAAQDKLTASQTAALRIEIDQTVTGLRAVELTRDQAKAQAEAAAAADRVLQQLQQEVGARQQLTDRLAEEVEEIGLSTRAVEELRTNRLKNALAIEQEAFFQAVANGATREQIDLLEKLLKLKGKEVDENEKRTAALDKIDRDPVAGAQRGLDDYLKTLQDKGRAVQEVSRTAAQSLEDDLVGSLRTGRLEASRTVDYIINEFLRLAVVKPLMQNLFGSFGSNSSSQGSGGSGGGYADLALAVAKFFGFSRGAAFDLGNVQPFAAGDVFHSPHLFRFAQGGAMATGVLGEAGPEAIMPLRRGADGRLGVSVNGGARGSSITINQVNHIGAGVSVTDVRLAMAQTKQETIAAIADMQRRGFGQQ